MFEIGTATTWVTSNFSQNCEPPDLMWFTHDCTAGAGNALTSNLKPRATKLALLFDGPTSTCRRPVLLACHSPSRLNAKVATGLTTARETPAAWRTSRAHVSCVRTCHALYIYIFMSGHNKRGNFCSVRQNERIARPSWSSILSAVFTRVYCAGAVRLVGSFVKMSWCAAPHLTRSA